MNPSQTSKIQDQTSYGNVQIAGFKANIRNFSGIMEELKDLNRGCVVQLMDADGVAGKKHVMHAVTHAENAFARGENIAKDVGLEICVRTSAQRQISRALDVLGIKEGKMNICAIAVGCEANVMKKLEDILGPRDDEVLKPDEEVLKKMYKVSDLEVETAGSILRVLMEKTALLILEK
jgi:KEOPS complex subunit Cgi121